MTQKLWAPLVYARTKETDFRLLAIPQDFEQEDKNWLEIYIAKTTQNAEELPHNPRWSFFISQKYCVVGVTCRADELVLNQPEYAELTKDELGRPLYLFVGYGTKLETHESLCYIQYYQQNLDIFAPLYEYVKEKWLSTDSKDTIKTTYARQLNIAIEPIAEEKPNLVPYKPEYQQLNWWHKWWQKIFKMREKNT